MFYLAFSFLFVGLVATLLCVAGVAGYWAGMTEFVAILFLGLFALLLFFGLLTPGHQTGE